MIPCALYTHWYYSLGECIGKEGLISSNERESVEETGIKHKSPNTPACVEDSCCYLGTKHFHSFKGEVFYWCWHTKWSEKQWVVGEMYGMLSCCQCYIPRISNTTRLCWSRLFLFPLCCNSNVVLLSAIYWHQSCCQGVRHSCACTICPKP